MTNLEDIKKNKLYYTSLSIIIILGVWFRLKALGKWPLAVDEYYIVKSIENILKYGIPKFEVSGYYERGILYQYISAFLINIGIKTEFAARIMPVVSNILIFPPLIILAKKISGKTLALIVTILVSFSLWEIEFARFARMYAPFQSLFIWYSYFLYLVIVEQKFNKWKWLFILSFISIFIYEGSIFILVLNFIPFLWFRRLKLRQFIISVLLFVGNFFYLRINFRMMGAKDLMPQEAINYHATLKSTGGLVKIPDLLVTTIWSDTLSSILFILVLLFNLFIIYKIIKLSQLSIIAKISIPVIVLSTLMNQFGLAIILVLIMILVKWIELKNKYRSTFKYLWAISLVNLIFWSIYSFTANSWYSLYPDFAPDTNVAILKRIFVLFFNYPGTYSTFWLFYTTIPNLTFLIIIVFSFGLFIYIKSSNGKKNSIRFLLVITIFSSILTTYLVSGKETRYIFYLYPIILLLVSISICQISIIVFRSPIKNNILTIILTFIFMLISEDYNFKHITNIDTPEYNFRMNYDEMLERHYYRRYDVRTPAEYVNLNAKKDDLILVNEMILEYYLKRLDYIFIDYRSGRFPILSTTKGKKERWTNANLIYTKEALLNFLLHNDKRVWFVVHKLSYIQKPLMEINFYNNFNKYLVYSSIDEMVEVYKIPNFR